MLYPLSEAKRYSEYLTKEDNFYFKMSPKEKEPRRSEQLFRLAIFKISTSINRKIVAHYVGKESSQKKHHQFFQIEETLFKDKSFGACFNVSNQVS